MVGLVSLKNEFLETCGKLFILFNQTIERYMDLKKKKFCDVINSKSFQINECKAKK